MLRFPRAFVFLVGWTLLPVLCIADEHPRAQIERMAAAASSVSFHGLLVYGYGNYSEPLEIARLQGSPTRERLFTLRGSPREVFRQDDHVRWVLPDQGVVLIEKAQQGRRRFSDITAPQLDVLDEYYSLKVVGDDRIADRGATVIDLQPLDDYRYGYRLWLDRETGMLIASECRSADGEIIEHFMFVQLETDPPADAIEARIGDNGLDVIEVPRPPEDESADEWRATRLPPGFELLSRGSRWRPGDDEPVQHLLYGDGFGAVSIYIADGQDVGFHGQSGKGATRMAGANREGHHITVVGEVPSATIDMVLSGVQRRAGGSDDGNGN